MTIFDRFLANPADRLIKVIQIVSVGLQEGFECRNEVVIIGHRVELGVIQLL